MIFNSRKLSAKFFKDKNGNVILVQRPNLLLLIWAFFSAISFLIPDENLKAGSKLTASAALFCWAYMEVTTGVNYFRKLLGIVVLLAVIINFFN